MLTQSMYLREGMGQASFLLFCLLFLAACDSVLDTQPQGSLNRDILANEEGVDRLLVGTYAALDGQVSGGNWYSADDHWVWGSVASDDAYKGSTPGDQSQITTIERFEIQPNSSGLWQFWRTRYDGVARANETLRLLADVENAPEEWRSRVEAEAKFLRAHYHFELKRIFNNIPYITEDLEDVRIPNTTDVWPKIEADFEFAAEHLPPTQPEVGRANSWAAKAYLAKVHLYQQDFTTAKPLFDDVIGSGPYDLQQCYADMFNPETQNNIGSVFEVQHSANDGTDATAAGRSGSQLNFPYGWGPGRCCGFFQPSVDFVNAFKVDEATGLPLFDTYNDTDLKNDQGIPASEPFTPDTVTPLDPRLDWSVGRRGVPYLDWGLHPGATAIRDQGYAGPYSPIKNVYYQRHEGVLSSSSGAPNESANNYSIIRFADVLLMAAEVEAELGNLQQARLYVNRVRERSDNCLVVGDDGTPAANYQVGLYEQPWGSLEEAREAIRFERRLELGMEGHRFYDLVRWGIAVDVMNEYLRTESEKRSYLNGATMPATATYFPIPEEEIERSAVDGVPVLVQNTGY